MDAISQTTLSTAFSWMKNIDFHWYFTEVYSQRSHWQYTNVGSDNGLAPTRRQAIIWTNDGLIYWCIYSASLGLNELGAPVHRGVVCFSFSNTDVPKKPLWWDPLHTDGLAPLGRTSTGKWCLIYTRACELCGFKPGDPVFHSWALFSGKDFATAKLRHKAHKSSVFINVPHMLCHMSNLFMTARVLIQKSSWQAVSYKRTDCVSLFQISCFIYYDRSLWNVFAIIWPNKDCRVYAYYEVEFAVPDICLNLLIY